MEGQMPLRKSPISIEQRETIGIKVLSLYNLSETAWCMCQIAVTTFANIDQSPFQWATIFHKSDINFTHGIHDLGWYDPTNKDNTHHLPCKVQCSFCRTPIMDEGRNMILLFPTLIEGITEKKVRDNFKPTCHMFYNQRVVDFKNDGVVKWEGLDNQSDLIDDEGKVLIKMEEGMGELS